MMQASGLALDSADRLIEQRLVMHDAAGLEGPPLADRISFGLASSIRVANSFFARSREHHRCTARSVAGQIATIASGNHRHMRMTRFALGRTPKWPSRRLELHLLSTVA